MHVKQYPSPSSVFELADPTGLPWVGQADAILADNKEPLPLAPVSTKRCIGLANGRLRLGHDHSPLEDVIRSSHVGIAMIQHHKPIGWKLFTEGGESSFRTSIRYYFETPGLARHGEKAYWVVRSALWFPHHMKFVVEDAVDQINRAVLLGTIRPGAIHYDSLAFLDRHFTAVRQSILDNLDAIARLPHLDHLPSGQMASCHRYIVEQQNRFDRLMSAAFLLLEKPRIPTNLLGLVAWVKDLDQLRKALFLPQIFRFDLHSKHLLGAARKAMFRGFQFAKQIGHEDSVSRFASGKPVEISHPDSPIKFVFQKRSYLPLSGVLDFGNAVFDVTKGHAPFCFASLFDVDAYAKTGPYLCRLCVYIEDTPILDQLSAMILLIESGEEDTLLRGANWFSLGDRRDLLETIIKRYPDLIDKLPGYRADEPEFDNEKQDTLSIERSGRLEEYEYDAHRLGPIDAEVRGAVNEWLAPILSTMDAVIAPAHHHAQRLFNCAVEEMPGMLSYPARPAEENA